MMKEYLAYKFLKKYSRSCKVVVAYFSRLQIGPKYMRCWCLTWSRSPFFTRACVGVKKL